MNEEVNRRNAAALHVQVKELSERLYAALARIDGLQNTLASVVARIERLEREAILARAGSAGRGPTAR